MPYDRHTKAREGLREHVLAPPERGDSPPGPRQTHFSRGQGINQARDVVGDNKANVALGGARKMQIGLATRVAAAGAVVAKTPNARNVVRFATTLRDSGPATLPSLTFFRVPLSLCASRWSARDQLLFSWLGLTGRWSYGDQPLRKLVIS